MAEITRIVPVTNLDDYLAAVDRRLDDRWELGSTITEDMECVREEAIRLCLDGLTAEQAADEIGSNWEPTDAELIAYNPVGTPWHDGCR